MPFHLVRFSSVHWGLTPPQQPGSYQGGEMMMMKSVIWPFHLASLALTWSELERSYRGHVYSRGLSHGHAGRYSQIYYY